MKAMIFAAGLGTRLKPLTDKMPKALVSINGTPLLEILLKKLEKDGFTDIVINVHHFADMIEEYVKTHHFNLNIKISDERQNLLDTGGGLKHASTLFEGQAPILIHNVDILSNASLTKLYNTPTNNEATLLVSKRKTQRYLLFDNEMNLMGWTNIATGEVRTPYSKLNPDNYHKYAFSGIHLFSPSLFKAMESEPNKFSIIDFYLKNCAKHRIKGFFQNDLELLDVGKLNTITEAEKSKLI